MKIFIQTMMVLTALHTQASEQQTQGGSFLTVGGDNSCQFQTIQDAIDNGLSNTIRIASNKNYFENIDLSNSSKSLIGGYADCTQAQINITDLSQALITASSQSNGVYMNNTAAQNNEVLLRNLVIANANVGVKLVAQNGSDTSLTLNNVRLFNNSGRGLSVSSVNSGEASLVLNDAHIDFNGNGGISCADDTIDMKITGDTLIENNVTNASGGGIWAGHGCGMEIYSPAIIKNNHAELNGGGLHVLNASVGVYGIATTCENGICFGDWDDPVTFSGNEADSNQDSFGDGGGVHVAGNGSLLFVYNALFENNMADNGGAIKVDDGAQVVAAGFKEPGENCWTNSGCLQFKGNQAMSGGVIYLETASKATLAYADITGNKADTGVVAHVRESSEFTLVGSAVHHNGEGGSGNHNDENLFTVSTNIQDTDGVIVLDGVTIADNDVTDQVIENNESDVSVFASIIFADVPVYQPHGNPQSHFECVIAHENSSFSAGGTVSVYDPNMTPMFVNPNQGNYHLDVNSPAIDYCYNASGQDYRDMDFDTRGVDDLNVPNLHGFYDIGADEYHASNDIIFENGFD